MLDRILQTAEIMQTKYIRIFSFYPPKTRSASHEEMRSEVFDNLERAVCLAKEYGVTLCHENEARIYGDVPKRCLDILDHFGGEIKCVFDMGNFVLEGVDPYPEAYELLKKHIAYFHIKDALFAGAIVPPGKGEAKIKEILCEHKKYADESFFVSLEPHLQLSSGHNALVGRPFKNPYQYDDKESAFEDAVTKLMELI